MKRLFVFVLLLFLQAISLQAQESLSVSDSGAALRKYYLSLDVEHLWIKGHHVNWETGAADMPNATHNTKTHCSSFVAAACERKNIYILRPPEHSPTLLANAQDDWLHTRKAKRTGWHIITGNNRLAVYQQVQEYANKGYVVVAVYRNPDDKKTGHIALVMPEEMTFEEIEKGGPELIMAGHKNSSHIPLREGFEKHIKLWPEEVIDFYYYEE